MLTNELEGVNKDVYKTDWQWQEGEYTVTRTNMWTAPGCHNGCYRVTAEASDPDNIDQIVRHLY